jgi:hypothetical protein
VTKSNKTILGDHRCQYGTAVRFRSLLPPSSANVLKWWTAVPYWREWLPRFYYQTVLHLTYVYTRMHVTYMSYYIHTHTYCTFTVQQWVTINVNMQVLQTYNSHCSEWNEKCKSRLNFHHKKEFTLHFPPWRRCSKHISARLFSLHCSLAKCNPLHEGNMGVVVGRLCNSPTKWNHRLLEISLYCRSGHGCWKKSIKYGTNVHTVVRTPTSYSGGRRFKSQPTDLSFFFVAFLSPCRSAPLLSTPFPIHY